MSTAPWQAPLIQALNSNEPEAMKAALEHAPPEALAMAVQYVKDQGHNHYRQQNYEAALGFYDQAISIESKDFYVLLHRANCLLSLKRPEQAREAAAYCATLHSEYPQVHELHGEACIALKDKPAGLDSFRKALELAPDQAKLAKRVADLEKEITEADELLKRVFQEPETEQPQEQPAQPQLPDLVFEASLLTDREEVKEPKEPMRLGLTSFLGRYADVEAPRELIANLEERGWLEPWLQLVKTQPSQELLIWGSLAGLLPLTAMDHGATRVVAWEPSPLTRRLAQGITHKNMVRRLQTKLGAGWEALTQEERKAQFEGLVEPYDYLQQGPLGRTEKDSKPCQALIFTDFDHGLLGNGAVAAIRACQEKQLTANAAIYPGRARIYAIALQWDYQHQGIDLSELNSYRWTPYPKRVTLSEGGWQALSSEKEVAQINLANFATSESTHRFEITTTGQLHGIAFWYTLELGDISIDCGPDGGLQLPGQAYQYVDTRAVAQGDKLAVTVRVDEDRIFFQTEPAIREPRKQMIPFWRAGMAVEDAHWNSNYLESLNKALARNKPKTLLNIGGGDGFLAMAAARAGVQVYTCEVSQNLSSALKNSLRRNDLESQVQVYQGDCRKMAVPEEIPEKVDMVYFDCFDCGLLGNGIIHYLEHTLAKLAAEGAYLLPRRARIKGMLIERRIEQIAGFDVTLITPYLFAPEYIQVDLTKTAHKPLTEPFELFAFEFGKAQVAEEEREYSVAVTADGTLGGLVFWYELDLDEETTLTSSPYGTPHRRGQALQFLAELRLDAGMTLQAKAKHTASNLAFAIKPDGLDKERIVSLPRFDPSWMSMQQNLTQQSGQMMQQLYGNPEEYVKAGTLAARMAAHPADYGITAAMAERFYSIFMIS